MPFGLSVAPWAFSRITKPIKSHLHLLLYRFHTYLDDFLLLAPTRESLVIQTSYILSLLHLLGLKVHLTKSHLAPSQTVEYLGVVLHLDTLQITLPESKVSKILSICRDTLRRRRCSRRHLESLVGILSFASYYIPLGRLRLRPIISWMNADTSTDQGCPLKLCGQRTSPEVDGRVLPQVLRSHVSSGPLSPAYD